MNKYTVILFVSASIFLTGCTTNSSPESDPTYVSPTLYQEYNCKQLRAEKLRLNSKIEQAGQADSENQVLSTVLSAYAISQGRNVYQAQNTELQRLQNQYDVLEQTAIKKECSL